MTKYDYIPTEFGRIWVASRSEARRGVFTPLSYIDINEGNRFDADVFAQIMYWHEPNTETGESRLSRQKDGNYWLTKNHGDWFKETRIKLQTVRKCLDRLKDRELIVYELGGEKGNVTPWIRVNWQEFERRIKLWIENNIASVSEKDYQAILDTLYHTPVTTEQGGCSEITETVLPDNTPLLPEVKSNTETTSETAKNELEIPAPIGTEPAPIQIPVVIDAVTQAVQVIEQVTKKPRKINPNQSTHDELLSCWGLTPDKVTRSGDRPYWVATAELASIHFPIEAIKPLYNWCKAQEWPSLTVMAMAKYAGQFLVTWKKPTASTNPAHQRVIIPDEPEVDPAQLAFIRATIKATGDKLLVSDRSKNGR